MVGNITDWLWKKENGIPAWDSRNLYGRFDAVQGVKAFTFHWSSCATEAVIKLRNASHSASPVPLGTRERMYIHSREISKSKVPRGAPTAWLWVAFSTPPQNPPPISTSRLPSERLCHAILDLLSARACATAFPLLYLTSFTGTFKLSSPYGNRCSAAVPAVIKIEHLSFWPGKYAWMHQVYFQFCQWTPVAKFSFSLCRTPKVQVDIVQGRIEHTTAMWLAG